MKTKTVEWLNVVCIILGYVCIAAYYKLVFDPRLQVWWLFAGAEYFIASLLFTVRLYKGLDKDVEQFDFIGRVFGDD